MSTALEDARSNTERWNLTGVKFRRALCECQRCPSQEQSGYNRCNPMSVDMIASQVEGDGSLNGQQAWDSYLRPTPEFKHLSGHWRRSLRASQAATGRGSLKEHDLVPIFTDSARGVASVDNQRAFLH